MCLSVSLLNQLEILKISLTNWGQNFINVSISFVRNSRIDVVTDKTLLIYILFLHGSSVGIATELHAGRSGDRIPVGATISARPDWPWGPPSLLYNGYRVFPGGKVRRGCAAEHSPPSSAEVLEEQSYTSITLWVTNGPVAGLLYFTCFTWMKVKETSNMACLFYD
jgi:hypothetical protein